MTSSSLPFATPPVPLPLVSLGGIQFVRRHPTYHVGCVYHRRKVDAPT